MKAKEEKFLSRGWVGTEPEFDPPDEVSTKMVNTVACRHSTWMTKRMRAKNSWSRVVCRSERNRSSYSSVCRVWCPGFPMLHPSQRPPSQVKSLLGRIFLR